VVELYQHVHKRSLRPSSARNLSHLADLLGPRLPYGRRRVITPPQRSGSAR
jgi:hypothetical protein